MRLKLLFITVALFVGVGSSYGQLLQWNTFGNTGTETTEPSVANDANIAAANLTFGVGVTANANGNRFGGSNWLDTGDTNPTILAESISGNDYIQFVVTPNSGYSFTPTSFVFSWDRSSTGPSHVTLRSSVDGYVADLGTITGMAASITTGNTITISGITNITSATTFRIYGYGATATGGTGGLDVTSNVVNVVLNGTTASIGPTSTKSGDWNDSTVWSTGSVPTSSDNVTISAAHTVYSTTALTRTGTTNVNGGFELRAGGWASGTNFTYGATGTLIFNQSSGGSYDVNNGDVFWPATNGPFNVTNIGLGITMNSMTRTVAGTYATSAPLTNASNLTVNGTCQINSTAATFDSALAYGSYATLIYNVNNTIGRGNEWNNNPANVTLQNNSVLNYPNGWGTFTRALTGNLTIDSGSALYMDWGSPASGVGLLTIGGNALINGNLSLGNQAGGDIAITGNWTRANAAVFNPNGRAVIFNGSTTQNLTVTGGTSETFNYLTVAGSGTLKSATGVAINVTGNSGLSLSSTHATSTIDLNGQTLTLSGGGNLNLNGGNRFVTSSTVGGIFKITSATTTVTNGGSLTTSATNTKVDLQNGLNCGIGSLVTINGILQINAGGFCSGASPKYSASSLLQYNSNTTYNRQLEWTGNGTNAGTGIPQNVQISNNTTLNYINAGNSGAKGIAGNLIIDSGSSLIMNYGGASSIGALTISGNLTNAGSLILGQSSGDDLKLGGNFTNTGTFNGNNRAVFFIRSATGTQVITAPVGITIPYIVIQPTSGTDTVQLAPGTNLTISAPLGGTTLTFTNATDILDINSNTLTIGTTGVANSITGAGTFKGSTTSNLTLLGTGSVGTLNFTTGSQVLGNLTLDRQSSNIGFDLGTGLTINGTLALTNGIANLSNQTMIITLAGLISGASSSNYIIADFTAGGVLRKNFNANGSFTFPIGDRVASADGTQYSPATINFTTANYSSGWAALAIEDNFEPNIDASTDFITRYWKLTSSGITSATYNFTGTYLPADISGTETNCKSGRYSTSNSTWTDGANLVSGANTISLTGLTSATGALTSPNHFTASYRNREINIKGLTGGTNDIVSGSATANGLNNTLFAETSLGSTATKDYEIQNLGIAALNLTGTPIVSIGGANPGDFTVTTAPSLTTITGGSSTAFIITFSPTYAGIRTAIVSIANNDSTISESPYTFLIQGTAICPTTTNTVTPTSGPVGTEVTITATANNLTGTIVTFNGVAATAITYVTSTQIKVLVPAGATSGNLVTTIATGCQATNTFTVIENVGNSCEGGSLASDLFISEVTDSNYGGLTYIEIYNGTGVTKNLSGYSINTASNGGSYSGAPLTLNNVNLASGSIYVIALGDDDLCSSSGGNGSLATQSSVNFGINFDTYQTSPLKGNDHIALFNGATQIDSWGVFGNPSWATSTLSIFTTETDGATFRRKNTSTLPSTTYNNSDWDIIDYVGTKIGDCANNDYTNIGTYNFISGTPPTATIPSYTATCKTAKLSVSGTEGYNGTSPADTKELTYKWLVSAPNATVWTEITDGTNYSGSSTATLSIANISTIINYQYYCQIRENTNTCYTASNAVKIIDGTITWNGTNWRDVNNVITTPSLSKLAVINANYDTSLPSLGSFNACSVVVNSPYTLTITADEYVKIENDLTNNGVVTIKNDGSLVQVNDSGINTGIIKYERTTPPIFRTDYTYWASPVAGYTLGGVSQNLTLGDKYYSYDPSAEDWKQESPLTTMLAGTGYIIRGDETEPTRKVFNAFFIGKPNNGEYTIPNVVEDKSYLLGNPYPSALDADTFLDANSDILNGTLYFWTHNTPLSLAGDISNPGPGWAYTYSLDDYAVYNITGGVGIDPGTVTGSAVSDPDHSVSGVDLGNKPTGKIASGQGFFASSKTTISGADIVFNNSMRVGVVDILKEDNTQFFKTISPKTKLASIEKHRIWLNLKNTQGAFKQTLVGYITDATNEYDSRFDGESFDANEFVDFYSLNQDKNLVIQGRALPFDENDEVPLGYRTTIEGDFTINIDQVDGVLTNQAVFIEDKLTNTVFDLKSGNYTFNTVAGTFNDRFILRYTNKTLGTADFETLESQVLVSNKNKQIKVNSAVEIIDKVMVYDLLGRQIYKKEKVNSNELTLTNFNSSQQTLLVKVILQNGQTVTRKVMY